MMLVMSGTVKTKLCQEKMMSVPRPKNIDHFLSTNMPKTRAWPDTPELLPNK